MSELLSPKIKAKIPAIFLLTAIHNQTLFFFAPTKVCNSSSSVISGISSDSEASGSDKPASLTQLMMVL
jgi:hypothetical protein